MKLNRNDERIMKPRKRDGSSIKGAFSDNGNGSSKAGV